MLEVRNLNCGILRGINFNLAAESCLGVSGPSGSGKTTLLAAIAGNVKYEGTISYEGRDLCRLKPWQRPFRYLNQRLYLFPYLTVDNNLKLAQYAAGEPRDKSVRRHVLDELGIAHLADKYPGHISGGEQQRAALARALVASPRLLLLDEPFSSLDWPLREKLWQLLNKLRKKLSLTILLVSHEPKEIAALADCFLTMQAGQIIQNSES